MLQQISRIREMQQEDWRLSTLEATMQQEDWTLKFEQLRRYHHSVARQWMRTQDLEREEQNNVVQKYEKKIADLKQEKKELLLELEKAHTMGLQSAQARMAVACELACYKLRNMR